MANNESPAAKMLEDRLDRKPVKRESKARVEAGKMHLYVNGKHMISVDEAVAHEVANTYAREFNDVWLTRAPVSMTEAKGGRMRGYGKR